MGLETGLSTTVNAYDLLSPAAVSARTVIAFSVPTRRSPSRTLYVCGIRKEGSDSHYFRAGNVHNVRGMSALELWTSVSFTENDIPRSSDNIQTVAETPPQWNQSTIQQQQ